MAKLRDNTISQSHNKNTNPLNFNPTQPNSDSDSDSQLKIQNKGIEKENSNSYTELKEKMTLQYSNKNSESGTTDPTQFRLDSDSHKKLLSRNYYKEEVEKNSATQGLTAQEQKIYDFLKKLHDRPEGKIGLENLSKEELKLLPDLKEKGYINFNNSSCSTLTQLKDFHQT